MSNLKYILLFLIISCSSPKPSQELYTISSKAKCTGPGIEYHTELHATTDGYFRFNQTYNNGDPDYDAVAYSDSIGFTMANDTINRTIETSEISVSKGHSFHMIALHPKVVFNYSNGKYFDAIGNEVIMHIESKRVNSFQITNPFDNTEKIDIYFSQWKDVQGFSFPMQVQIIQGGKKEYFFKFYEVKVNAPSFNKILLL